MDLYLFAEGNHRDLSGRFGAQPMCADGIDGVCFSVWAPNARRVSVVGDFNNWDGRRHPMRLRHDAGVWELFVPRLGIGEAYKFEVLGQDGVLPLKADPLARATELPPSTASKVSGPCSTPGRITTGCNSAPRVTPTTRRCRSTSCMPAPGAASWTTPARFRALQLA